jgi:hypothetical protein
MTSSTSEQMPFSPMPLCVLYVPGLDRRRLNASLTPYIQQTLDTFPSVRIRTQPTTELVPSMVTGTWPHEHETWQVSLRDDIKPRGMERVLARLPDFLTTTVQCCRHVFDSEYDLPAIPYWRRRRLHQHRFKYNRRKGAGGGLALQEFAGIPSFFKLLHDQSRYRFVLKFKDMERLLPEMPASGLLIEFVEFYGLDLFSHWNLDRQDMMAERLREVDLIAGQLHRQCQARGTTMLLLVDHGQEEVRGSIDIQEVLRASGVSREDYTFFVEVAGMRIWFHTEAARREIMPLLEQVDHVTILDNRAMQEFNICFEGTRFGETYLYCDHGYIFFPNDFYHPLANMYLGLRNPYLRQRLRNPRHRGYHGHLPDHESEEGYLVLTDGYFRADREMIDLIDVAPTLLHLVGWEQPGFMKGQSAFVHDHYR